MKGPSALTFYAIARQHLLSHITESALAWKIPLTESWYLNFFTEKYTLVVRKDPPKLFLKVSKNNQIPISQ